LRIAPSSGAKVEGGRSVNSSASAGSPVSGSIAWRITPGRREKIDELVAAVRR
jgi:hypothetical protein